MANNVTGNTNPSLVDIAKLQDESGKSIPYVAALSQANAITRVMTFIEGNQADGHKISVETYAPKPATRTMNRGVVPTFGKAMQIVEQTAQLKDWLEIDESVALRGGSINETRYNLAMSKMRAMGRQFAYLAFYGNVATNPTDFNGLSMRYGAISGAVNANNVLNAGGTNNNNASIWLVGLGPLAITGIYPKGSMAGFIHRDHGLQVIPNAADNLGGTNGRLEVYQDSFTWDGGLCVADWRFGCRVANIDVPSLNALTNDADLAYFMEEAWSRMPYLPTNEPPEPGVIETRPQLWYFMNRSVKRGLGHQLKQVVVQGSGVRVDNVRNELPKTAFAEYEYNNIPVGICDQLINTEGNVS